MSEGETPRPPRRQRYPGKNPRRFEDKYKELDPAAHSETVAKVLASGKTPAGSHVPIMVDECLSALDLNPGSRGIDCTLGYGGHALAILEKIQPGGMLWGLDQDAIELPKTEARIRRAGFGEDEFIAVRSNFAGMPKVLRAQSIDGVDFVFADLGCSSMQYDDPSRGFSFKHQGPLDMRMNPTRGLTAADLIKKLEPKELEEILRENSDEPQAGRIAAALAGRSFATTLELVTAIRLVADIDPENLVLKRVFQAIRIEVNDEFGALAAFLKTVPSCLKPGGRVAILTFHSGEDRRVKKSFQAGMRDGVYAAMSEGVITAGSAERRANPRSTAAKLRWAVKV
ncbi:MAG: 16S rRNA (cytosine(1402)-N(4))-methyltransferase RsmH [Verrucomicrobiota bacterium]